ncbi:MAG: hypothetical protein BGP06_12830 [Rhizobiales bacterium 65-9]|nr:hypothetical protein [Hyphomicrobiales bacterium]OJY37145.1 MAG: hypothetical protein BGP06_12830 [Rhizobiales bacterium 65-9]
MARSLLACAPALLLAGCALFAPPDVAATADETNCVARGFAIGLAANRLCADYAALDRAAVFDTRSSVEKARSARDQARALAFFSEVRRASRSTIDLWAARPSSPTTTGALRSTIDNVCPAPSSQPPTAR